MSARVTAPALVVALVLAGTAQSLAEQAQPVPAAGHDHAATVPQVNDHGPDDQHDHAPAARLPQGPVIPAVTSADRAAAFPDTHHQAHRERINSFVLFDQLEWVGAQSGGRGRWEGRGWVGRDVTRLWFRSDGAFDGDGVGRARVQAFYGRAVRPWWDVVAGLRQDSGPRPSQTWAAVGVQGLAPYWFDVQATAYIGAGGRTQAEVDVEYDLLLTNRLILQPRIEAAFAGKADPERGLGAGLTSTGAGVRVRYEIRRELAPYVGVTWDRTFGGTAAVARAAGRGVTDARLVLGVRAWF